MNEVFKLASRSSDTVVLEVITDDLLTVAQNPYIDGTYKYISVIKKSSWHGLYDYTLTVIHKDGKSFSFDWGASGHTLVSNRLEILHKKVVSFIMTEAPGWYS